MQPLVSVKGNSKLRVRNTYIGRCSLVESEQYQFQEITMKKTNSTNKLNCAFAGKYVLQTIFIFILFYLILFF